MSKGHYALTHAKISWIKIVVKWSTKVHMTYYPTKCESYRTNNPRRVARHSCLEIGTITISLPTSTKYWPAFNKLKIMSEVAHNNWKGLKLLTRFINEYFIEETAASNVSTEQLITMGGGRGFQSNIVPGKNHSCHCWVLQGGIMKDEKQGQIQDFKLGGGGGQT